MIAHHHQMSNAIVPEFYDDDVGKGAELYVFVLSPRRQECKTLKEKIGVFSSIDTGVKWFWSFVESLSDWEGNITESLPSKRNTKYTLVICSYKKEDNLYKPVRLLFDSEIYDNYPQTHDKLSDLNKITGQSGNSIPDGSPIRVVNEHGKLKSVVIY